MDDFGKFGGVGNSGKPDGFGDFDLGGFGGLTSDKLDEVAKGLMDHPVLGPIIQAMQKLAKQAPQTSAAQKRAERRARRRRRAKEKKRAASSATKSSSSTSKTDLSVDIDIEDLDEPMDLDEIAMDKFLAMAIGIESDAPPLGELAGIAGAASGALGAVSGLSGASGALGGATGALGGADALGGVGGAQQCQHNYEDLLKKYNGFQNPGATVEIDGKPFKDKAKKDHEPGAFIIAVRTEITCTGPASIGSFTIMNAYDIENNHFRMGDLNIKLGSSITISFGYSGVQTEVFRGLITGYSFEQNPFEPHQIVVHAMDGKIMMMSQLTPGVTPAKTPKELIDKILQSPLYNQMKESGIITGVRNSLIQTAQGGNEDDDIGTANITDTDYTRIEKALRKINGEIFIIKGELIIRDAKSGERAMPTIELSKINGIVTFNMDINIAGQTTSIEVRVYDSDQGKVKKKSKRICGSITGPAKSLLSKTEQVYIETSVMTEDELEGNVEYLARKKGLQTGRFEAKVRGLPELQPGNTVLISQCSDEGTVKVYVEEVNHEINSEKREYITTIFGAFEEVPG